MRKILVATVCIIVLLVDGSSRAQEFLANPQRSFFIGFDLGMAFDTNVKARSPSDYWDRSKEAYSLGAFLFGVSGGFRFNEVFGVEVGWHDQQHDAHPEWGGLSYYQLAHIAGRFAWPLPSRQTPVLRIGPALGQFAYGAASIDGEEDNRTFVLGGMAGLTVEHEFVLGIVGMIQAAYFPLYRFAMDEELFLVEEQYMGEQDGTILDSKDFSEGELVHLVWISLGIQFEWTFR